MSGGSYNYLQSRDTEEILEDAAFLQDMQHMSAALLSEYGEEGKVAGEATQRLHARFVEARDQIRAIVEKLDVELQPLRQVWRQVDYHGSMDISKADVIEELVKYNASLPSTLEDVAGKAAYAEYCAENPQHRDTEISWQGLPEEARKEWCKLAGDQSIRQVQPTQEDTILGMLSVNLGDGKGYVNAAVALKPK